MTSRAAAFSKPKVVDAAGNDAEVKAADVDRALKLLSGMREEMMEVIFKDDALVLFRDPRTKY